VEDERYLELLDILADGRHGDIFGMVERLLDEGYDLVEFFHGLMDALRVVLRLRLTPGASLDLRDDLRASFASRAERFAPGDLVRMLSAAAELESNGSLRRSPNPRILIEMLLLRLTYMDRTVDLEELLRAMGGAPPPKGGRRSGGGPGSLATAERGERPVGGRRQGAETPDAPQEEPAGGSPAAPGRSVEPSSDLPEAWSRWLDSGRGIPRGLGPFLRSSSVRVQEDGSIELVPPSGPAVERLKEAGVLVQVARGLEPFLGREVSVSVLPPEGALAPDSRVSPEAVREDTLKALYRKEPRLEQAVEELDLELFD
jgi:hypothetical protein